MDMDKKKYIKFVIKRFPNISDGKTALLKLGFKKLTNHELHLLLEYLDQLINQVKEDCIKRKSKWNKDNRELHYKYIYFIGKLDSERAGQWLCKNKRSKETLGTVYYHEKWKEWIFEGLEFSFFNYSCLLDISNFLQKLNSVKNLPILVKAVERHLNR